jgi:hypothetical protein
MAEKEAEDIRKAEKLLGKLLQNAKARGLEPTTGKWYRDAMGLRCDGAHAASCCAIGAALLESDTSKEYREFECIAYGNDHIQYVDLIDLADEIGFTIGAAFQHAMGARGRR